MDHVTPLLLAIVSVALIVALHLNRRLKSEISNRLIYDMIFRSSADMICVLDAKGLLKLVNPTLVRETGYEESELLANTAVVFIHPDDRKLIIRKALKSFRSSSTFRSEFRYIRKDGEVRVASWTAVRVEGTGLICVMGRDVTEKLQMETGLQRLDRLDLAGQMAASISHELRNPMTTVRGFLQMMMIEGKEREYAKYYPLMIEELDRANSIITEFLALARDRITDKRLGRLDCIVRAILPLIEAEILMEGKNLIADLCAVPQIMLDENEIKQLLLNLVKNAREATQSCGLIKVSTYCDDISVSLSVSNNGVPIPADVLSKLGTPFFTTKEKGTGLGMSVCYRIADRHAADIRVMSTSAETRFDVVFPIRHSETRH